VILYGRTLEQTIDRHDRATFVKELVVSGGRVPLAMVRKRLASNGGGTKAPILLVHGFGQNRYAWHLPARSFANYLARAATTSSISTSAVMVALATSVHELLAASMST